MRKVIRIGFPILCVAIIGGTFILLNRTTKKINRNKLVEKDIESQENIIVEDVYDNEENIVIIDSNQNKAQEVKNKLKAIEIVKELAPPTTNVYYTNEGTDQDKYIVAIRDNSTKDVKIYYAVDIVNEKIEIYVR